MANPNQQPQNKPADAKGDAGDPRTSGQPEQFLSEAPSNLAAQGAGAPPMPNARRYFRMPNVPGRVIGRVLRIGDTWFPLDPAEAAKHPDLVEVNADGTPLASRDKIATRETGEAKGAQTR